MKMNLLLILFVVINVLSTLPEYHRKGLGSRLLTHVTRDADKVNAKIYLQATPIGYPLYLRLGWQEIEDMVTSTPKGPVIWKCMIREPTLKN
jgi:GNAT superfamily N-acetyltransferase